MNKVKLILCKDTHVLTAVLLVSNNACLCNTFNKSDDMQLKRLKHHLLLLLVNRVQRIMLPEVICPHAGMKTIRSTLTKAN